MKIESIIVISIVAAVAIIGVVTGITISNQALEQSEYQRTLQESVSSKSESQSPSSSGTEITKNLEESVSASITQKPSTPKEISCDPSYPDVCIPPYPPDLNCVQVQYRDFKVLPPDPHGFDGNNDGIGCEL